MNLVTKASIPRPRCVDGNGDHDLDCLLMTSALCGAQLSTSGPSTGR